MDVYVRLLGEGVEVFRPVPSRMVSEGVFLLGGEEIYERADEEWEFLPGTAVRAVVKTLEGSEVLVAVGKG
jgi:hypothetical protein